MALIAILLLFISVGKTFVIADTTLNCASRYVEMAFSVPFLAKYVFMPSQFVLHEFLHYEYGFIFLSFDLNVLFTHCLKVSLLKPFQVEYTVDYW